MRLERILPIQNTSFSSLVLESKDSYTLMILLQDDQLVGVIGGSGGRNIIAAVIQVFINHFVLGMEPLDSVQSPRIYHTVGLN